MAKFFGEIGYGHTEETRPGIHELVVTEKQYYGDVIRNARSIVSGEYLNNDLTVDNSISVVADAYANEHFFAMRYVKWQGVLWEVSNVRVEPPRLILKLGGVYNGPIPDPDTP